MTWLFLAATIGLGVCAYKWTVLYLDERDKQIPLNPRLRKAWDGEPPRYRRTCEGAMKKQHKPVERWPRKVS